MVYFLSIISLLFIRNTEQSMLVGYRPDSNSLRCHNCPANNPDCLDTCFGRYCYKAEYIADEHIAVKRGCLNQTDSGIRVDFCEETPSDFPGSDFSAIDRICICTSDKCNIASTTRSAIINLCIVYIIHIFYSATANVYFFQLA